MSVLFPSRLVKYSFIYLPSIFLDAVVTSSAAISQLMFSDPLIVPDKVKSKYSPAVNLTFPVASVVGLSEHYSYLLY